MNNREAIQLDRKYLQRSGVYDMVQGYEPKRPYSVATKQWVETSISQREVSVKTSDYTITYGDYSIVIDASVYE